MTELSSIEVENLSLEEIEQILPQLYHDLKEVREIESSQPVEEEADDRPLNEIVEDKLSELWVSVERGYTESFNESLQKEHRSFILEQGLRVVLEPVIGKDHTKTFFKVAGKCVKEKNFRMNQRFFRGIDNPDLSSVARLSFAVYRINLPEEFDDSFVKRKRAKEYVSELTKSDDPLIKSVADGFYEVGLLPS